MAKISAEQLQEKFGSVRVPTMVVDPRELVAAQKMHEGMAPDKAVAEAGFKFANKSTATEFGERLKDKFNARMVDAYRTVGLTPEYIASKHKEMLDDNMVKPADKLKAIDQVLNVVGGYAPKQVDVTTITFEQTVIELANKVDLSKLSARDVRSMIGVTDAEFTEQTE